MRVEGRNTTARPLAARAQNATGTRRLGVLMQLGENDPEGQARIAAFRDALQKLSWQIGSNLQVYFRWGVSTDERARVATAELLQLRPDVILASSTVPLRATQQATHAVPVVFTTVIDPIGLGFIESLARPGGNTTGFVHFEPAVGGKWVDLLLDIAPRVTRIAFMFNPQRGPYGESIAKFVEEAARTHAVQYVAAPIFDAVEIEPALARLAREPGGGLIVSPDPFTGPNRKFIIEPANRYGLPAMYAGRNWVADGGLAAYGADYLDQFRGAATYVDRILRGAKPGDLPVQEPTKLELVINLKTAKVLGLTVPPTLLGRADEVIE
jgi:putative tryptophan/tyrosine transport system substrate-binding protein